MLRALSMVIDMAGNGATHREKSARLRGCSEMIESENGKLLRQQFDLIQSWYQSRISSAPDFSTWDLMRLEGQKVNSGP
jgi:hypothetical protein